jgi:hypothetical protein
MIVRESAFDQVMLLIRSREKQAGAGVPHQTCYTKRDQRDA